MERIKSWKLTGDGLCSGDVGVHMYEAAVGVESGGVAARGIESTALPPGCAADADAKE